VFVEDDDADQWDVCQEHPELVAVGNGTDSLREYCSYRFRPPTCAGCMLTWAWDRQKHLSGSYSWFFLILIALSQVFMSGAIARPGVFGGRMFLLDVLGAYVVASIVLSWRVDARGGARRPTGGRGCPPGPRAGAVPGHANHVAATPTPGGEQTGADGLGAAR
jgi:hypothetical protein